MKLLRGGLLAGLALFLGASLQQVGLVSTTAGSAGFITGLYVVIVPILGLIWRQRPALGTWLGEATPTATHPSARAGPSSAKESAMLPQRS